MFFGDKESDGHTQTGGESTPAPAIVASSSSSNALSATSSNVDDAPNSNNVTPVPVTRTTTKTGTNDALDGEARELAAFAKEPPKIVEPVTPTYKGPPRLVAPALCRCFPIDCIIIT